MILFDSACTVHVVTKSKLLNDFGTISTYRIQWDISKHGMNVTGRATLVTRNKILDGTTGVTSSEGCPHVLGFGTNLLSARKLSAKTTGTRVIFRTRAQCLDDNNNLMGYRLESVHRFDTYPLV